MLNNEQRKEVISRYPHETVVFISEYLGISKSTVENIAKESNLVRLHIDSRIPSNEFLASYYNVNLQMLTDIEDNAVFLKPFPDMSDNLRKILVRKHGKPMSIQRWNSITSALTFEQIRHIMIYYPQFTNRALAYDLNVDRGIITEVGRVYSLEKLEREQMFCDTCRVNHLPDRSYNGGNNCKQCWTERMSQYQYVYYPAKKAATNK
jgi:hypothetical protein